MFKRVLLFFSLNLAIIVAISCIMSIFHVGPYLTRYGIDYQALMIFCLIWGMTGALISLLLSKQMAKWLLGVRTIDPYTTNNEERMIYDMVVKLSQAARLPDVPEVGIFPSEEPNAFATGPTKRRSLVALSRGLLRNLSKDEIEAVIGHEIAHIANGDMVTMTLLQGVINAFVMFLARVLAYAVSTFLSRDRNGKSHGSYMTFTLFTVLFEIVFMVFGTMIIAFFSRIREFRADRESAQMLGKAPMIQALRKLQKVHALNTGELKAESVAALMITTKKRSMLQLFATHPSLDDRIARLESL